MGSPNFYTARGAINFGLNLDALQERYGHLSSDEIYYYVSELHRDVEQAVEEANSELIYGEITFRAGYHDGFQVYFEPDEKLPDLIAESLYIYDCNINHVDDLPEDDASEMYLIDKGGYKRGLDEVPNLGALGIIEYQTNPDGDITSLGIKPNHAGIARFVEELNDKARHLVAKIAKDYNLREVIGLSWAQSLASAEDSAKEIELHYFPDIFETEYDSKTHHTQRM